MDRAATFELEMTRLIRAPRERVFDAFTDQAALATWHCPRGMSVLEASADPRVGGRYRVVMGGRDGSRHIAVGEYQKLDRADFLAYTWAWESGSMPPDLKTLIEVTLTSRTAAPVCTCATAASPTRRRATATWPAGNRSSTA